MAALGAGLSELAMLAVYTTPGVSVTSEFAMIAVVSPPETQRARAGDLAVLASYAKGVHAVPMVSELSELSVYSTAFPAQEQTLAWTFSLDGHTFYVLDIGEQGTFLYDIVTQNWCQFQTQNSVGWNLRNGCMWWTGAPRIVGGDSTGPYTWELDPTALFDDGFRDVEHAATSAVELRSRVYVSMSELRIAASAGLLDDTAGAVYMQLTYSDNGGQTYSDPLIVQLTAGTTPDGQQDIRFSSLGSFMAPGRILQISDVGGVLRLDGVDAMIDGYDGEPEQPQAPP
jgi:hypothetical protein